MILPTSTSVGLFITTLTIVNGSPNQNVIEIKSRDIDGVVTATGATILAPYAFFHTDNIHALLGISGTFGPIELTAVGSSQGDLLAGSRVYSTLPSLSPGQTSSFFSAVPF